MRFFPSAVPYACLCLLYISCSDAEDGRGGVDAQGPNGSGGATGAIDGSGRGPPIGGSAGQGGGAVDAIIDGGAGPDGKPDAVVPTTSLVLEVGGRSDSACTARWGQGSDFRCSVSAHYVMSSNTTLVTISDGRVVLAGIYLRGPLQVRSYHEGIRTVGHVERDGKRLEVSKFDLRVLDAAARPGPFDPGDEVYDFTFKLNVNFGD